MLLNVICFSLVFTLAFSNKYTREKNSVEYEKLLALEKPFRIQKLNLVWEKAVKKIPAVKLKQLYTDLKFQDKEEVGWKVEKAKGLDKEGLKEAMIQGTFKAILEKYHLWQEYEALQESVLRTASTHRAEVEKNVYEKAIFKDKKLNKLWLKAEQQGFSEQELRTLQEEFQHHQNKIDQYYQILNQLHKQEADDDGANAVEHVLHAEEGKSVKTEKSPHQVLKEKHADLKVGYDYLTGRVVSLPGGMAEFEEPQVDSLWQMAKNASFSPEELDSLRNELYHFEHRVKKLKILTEQDSESDHDNAVDEVSMKREKKLKEYGYKVEKIQRDLSSRILQRHSKL